MCKVNYFKTRMTLFVGIVTEERHTTLITKYMYSV